MIQQQNSFKWKVYKFLLRVRPTIIVHILKQIVSFKRTNFKHLEGWFWIDPISNLGIGIAEDIFEPEDRKLIKSNLSHGDIFIDIGANEGFYTVIGAKAVSELGKVIAVEPQTRLMSILSKNVELNDLHNVTLINSAISDGQIGELEIYLSPSTNTGASSITNKYFISNKQAVVAQSLESIFDEYEITTADFVKVDVEGFEAEVIRGAANLLADHRIQRLYVDFHASILQKRNIDAHELHDLIISYGYITVDRIFHPSGYNLYVLEK